MPDPPGFRIVGAPRGPVRDGFHRFLRWPWSVAIGVLVSLYLAVNAVFALAYLAIGGIENARPGSFADAFYFSVQTMGTIGYGAMYPKGTGANLLVVAESVTGLLATALATGLVYSKFARTRAHVVTARQAVIASHEGVPTLMVRIGNERENRIVDATFRATLVRTERSKEGVTYYRFYELPLLRPRTAALARVYQVMHPITPESALYGYTPERAKAEEVEVHVEVLGIDDITLQPVHAVRTYTDAELLWGHRYSDVLSAEPDGTILVDLTQFHVTRADTHTT